MANRRPLSYPRFQAWDDDETFLNGGTVTFYDAGTTNKRNIYQDAALTTTAPNPVSLNSRGEPESAGGTPIDIYLDSNAYKIVLKDSSGVTVHTIDGYIQNPNPLTPNSPTDAKDQSTDVFEGTLNNDPVSGDIFEVDFKSANTTTTPTFENTGGGLGALTIKTWDKSPVWSHAISGVHSLYYDGTDYLVINPHDGIRTVDSLSNLQALVFSNIPDGYTAYLRGRSSLGDGGEGHFRWDSSNLSTEVGNDEVTANEGDGGIYVAPASDKTGASGAWVRQIDGPIRVEAYGAFADGTAVTGNIQAAFDGLNNFGGGTLLFGVGTYIVDDHINLYGDHVTLQGISRRASIIKRQDSSESVSDEHLLFIGEGTSNPASFITVRSLTIDGNRANNTGGALSSHNIRIENATDVLIEDFESRNAIYYGLHIRGEDAKTARITVRDGYIHSTGRDCLDIKDQGNFNDSIILDGIVAETCGLQDVGDDSLFDLRGPVLASNLYGTANATAGNSHHALRVRGLDNATVEGRVHVTNWRFGAESGHGATQLVLVEGVDVKLSNGLAQASGGVGVQINGNRVSLSSVQSRDCTDDGFYFVTSDGEKAKVTNCISEVNGGAGFDIDASFCKFSNCEARSNTGTGVDVDAGTVSISLGGFQSTGNGTDYSINGDISEWPETRSGFLSYTTTSGGNFGASYTRAFPNATHSVVAVLAGNPGDEHVQVDSADASGFVLRHRPSPGSASRTSYYIAHGY